MNRRLLLGLLLSAPALAGRRRENREACDRIDRRLQEIESQRRAGYSAKQGRKLATRRDELERSRRELCR